MEFTSPIVGRPLRLEEGFGGVEKIPAGKAHVGNSDHSDHKVIIKDHNMINMLEITMTMTRWGT